MTSKNVASVRKSILHFQLSDKTLTLRSMYPAALAFMLVSANHGRLRVCKCSSQGMFNICDCRSRNVQCSCLQIKEGFMFVIAG